MVTSQNLKIRKNFPAHPSGKLNSWYWWWELDIDLAILYELLLHILSSNYALLFQPEIGKQTGCWCTCFVSVSFWLVSGILTLFPPFGCTADHVNLSSLTRVEPVPSAVETGVLITGPWSPSNYFKAQFSGINYIHKVQPSKSFSRPPKTHNH